VSGANMKATTTDRTGKPGRWVSLLEINEGVIVISMLHHGK